MTSQCIGGELETQEEGGGSIVALIDNRAREVGFAAFNSSTLTLSLCQYIESGSAAAVTTAMLLKLHDAREAVLLAPHRPTGNAANSPNSPVQQAGPSLPDVRHFLPRSSFDDSKGLVAIETCAVQASWDKLCRATAAGGGNAGFYLACGAAGALLQHLMDGAQVLANSLAVELVGTSAHMKLDAGSVESLEILPQPTHGVGGSGVGLKGGAARQRAPGAAAPAGGPTNFRRHLSHRSLLHCMNHTRTSSGQRLLRASLLQPLTNPEALAMRYDCVEELLERQDMSMNVGQVLSALSKNIDKVCSRLVILPPKPRAAGNVHADPTARISAMVNAMLLLRSTLKVLPALRDSLEGAESLLLRAVHRTCQEGALAEVLEKIDEVIDTDAELSTSPLMNRVQQCFAVRRGADEFLDVARSSFQRITDKVHVLAESYRQEVADLQDDARGLGFRSKKPKCSSLQVKYSNRRGFALHVPLPSDARGNPISLPFPRSFLPVEKRGRSSQTFTTHELNALNARLQDAAHDCMVLTEKVLEQLVASIAAHLPLILRVADNVAMLDMLLAFSEAARQRSYSRPQLQSRGQLLAIVQGRHPLLEGNLEEPFHPNDTYIDGDCESLHIVTGPNMAGKSTYLKQVALLVVMAQAGSFVPAEFMALCPFRSLFTRMGTGDSIETNSSSFMLECQEVAHILDHASANSLVIIDELGRATSTSDGVALAWAVCEALLATHTPCLFATHFVQLADLATLYPAAKLWSLQVDISQERMDYTWQLSSATSLERVHYGIALARSVGFPQEVLDMASNIAEQVEESDRARARGAAGAEQGDHATWNAVYAAASKLLALARQCDSRVALGLQQHDGQQQPPQQQQQQQQPPPAASPCASASQHRSNHAKEHLTGSETTPHTGCGTTPHTGSGITAHTGSGTTPCTHGGQQTSLKAAGRRTAPGAQHDGTAAREAAIVGSAQLNSTADNTMEEAAVAEALQLSACKRQLEELAAARPTGAGASTSYLAKGEEGKATGHASEESGHQAVPGADNGQGEEKDVGPEVLDMMTDEEALQFVTHLHNLQLDVAQHAELEPSKLQALMHI